MRYLVPIVFNVKSLNSSLVEVEWQKKCQTNEKTKFRESLTYESCI